MTRSCLPPASYADLYLVRQAFFSRGDIKVTGVIVGNFEGSLYKVIESRFVGTLVMEDA